MALAGVSKTKHNLSSSGPGPIKAVGESQVCIFCHTPHNAKPEYPLWNHDLSAVTNYTNYWRPSLKAYASEKEAPPIDGFSKLCLGCHDGTVALGAIRSRQKDIQMVPITGVVDQKGRLLPGARGYIGTDLSGGHPISFVFDEDLKNRRNREPKLMDLKWPIKDPDIKLDNQSKVQCTSCHDPHESKAEWPPFWRKATYDEVCEGCHEF